ncbi:unnamed protein product [Moneuplotes crassus]|uniref:Calponin-homology (CH) domain-containing protein n=2 Tax=Euplotes crassus TaxID=5936 RepID=A0AAD1XQF6_EUPCR|nr:unnamed protein product [Moneuplotes crassus]CAI2376922.1 unnamed protein product [Moneuplotes crassus]
MGRLELLAWLNDFIETDYTKLEQCADGVGYAQIIDAIHPGVVPLYKMDFNARHKEDFVRNLNLLDRCLNRLKISKTIPVDQISKAKFQSNMEFVQWLYSYTTKTAPNAAMFYNGYEKRVQAYCKQKGIKDLNDHYMEINQHLIPNKAVYRNDIDIEQEGYQEYDDVDEEPGEYYQHREEGMEEHYPRGPAPGNPLEEEGHFDPTSPLESTFNSSSQDMGDKRKKQLNDLVLSLENELTEQLYSHKIFLEDINRIEEEKNFYYDRLRLIEDFVSQKKDSLVKRQIIDILAWAPEDFIEKN